jgi:hypothetical protein
MLRYSTAFANELSKIINLEIERLTENLTLGMSVSDYAAYTRIVGEISGLRRAVEYFEEAEKNADQR